MTLRLVSDRPRIFEEIPEDVKASHVLFHDENKVARVKAVVKAASPTILDIRNAEDNGYAHERMADLFLTRNFAHQGTGVGFYNTAPIAKPTAPSASVADAPAGGVGAAAGGWDTAANRDAAIATINNNHTRIGEIENKLRALGLIT